ncbi:MAG: hypothetical protein ACPKPY_13230, partial [Nitrososphaeraceae archaeon]
CPLDTPMAGAVVTDFLLCQAPNDANKCAENTDLPGVYVMNPETQCNIVYESCDEFTPLGMALGLSPGQVVEVVDDALCALSVPEAVQLFTCEAGSNLGEGALVTNEQLCDALVEDVVQCEVGTTLEGVIVAAEDAATCDLAVPPVVMCPIDIENPMSGAIVTDMRLCNAPTDAIKCPALNPDNTPTDLPNVYVMNDNAFPAQCNIVYPTCDNTTPVGVALGLTPGQTIEVVDDAICQLPFEACGADTLLGSEAIVTDAQLCNATTDAVKCGEGTEFAGFYVMEGMEDQLCDLNLNIPTTTTCQNDDPLPQSLGIPGNEITVLTGGEEVCQTSAVTICAENTNLAGAVVTDVALCDAITETTGKSDLEICEFCINLSTQSSQSGQQVLELGNATNAYVNEGNDLQGAWGICSEENPVTTFKGLIDAHLTGDNNDEVTGLWQGLVEQNGDVIIGCMEAAEFGGTEIATLNVTKETPGCFVDISPGPGTELVDCISSPIEIPIIDAFEPNLFDITVTGNNVNPSNFLGSNDGVLVTLDQGSFDVSEEASSNLIIGGPIPIPQIPEDEVPDDCQEISPMISGGPFNTGVEDGGIFFCVIYSDECSGTINQGDNLECTIENYLLVIQ